MEVNSQYSFLCNYLLNLSNDRSKEGEIKYSIIITGAIGIISLKIISKNGEIGHLIIDFDEV